MTTDIEQTLNDLCDNERWAEAERLLRQGLSENKDSHWWLSELAGVLYESRKYKESLKYARMAFKIMPGCPAVRWELAGSLFVTGHQDEAIKLWRGLLSQDIKEIAYGPCDDGLRWAKSVRNDARFRLGSAYLAQGNKRLAIRYLREHLTHRQRGLPSLYTKKKAQSLLREAERR